MTFRMKKGRGFKPSGIIHANVTGRYINGLQLEIDGQECVALYEDITIFEMSDEEKNAPIME